MTSSASSGTPLQSPPLVFDPPSPGSWELERTHATKPLLRFISAIFPSAMMRGFRRRAEELFRDRPWRQDLIWWDTDVKPGMLAEARALVSQDMAACSVPDLVAHLRRASALTARAVENHHRFNCTVMVPQADYLVHVMDWTGLSSSEVLETLQGLSPASAGAVDELNRLTTALAGDSAARALLFSQRPSREILDRLQTDSGPVGEAIRQYLDLVGLRIVGSYDVASPHARDNPDLLVRILRAAAEEGQHEGREAAAALATSALRARVPPEHRDEFDALLAEARLTYRLRDERNFFGDALAVGRDPSGLGSVQAGEILVTPSTSPTFNVVLPLLGALVTERGGALSRAAIVAREYGLPAVVGCPAALEAIQSGVRLKVDGTTGEVRILG